MLRLSKNCPLALAAVGLCAVGACSYGWTFDKAKDAAVDAPGSPGGASGGGGQDPGGTGGTIADSGADADEEPEEADSAGQLCSPAAPCSTGSYCRYADHQCGSGAAGICAAVGPSPDAGIGMICHCDGSVDSAGSAIQVDVSPAVNCPEPAGTFRCGYRFCSIGTEMCHVYQGEYSCEPGTACAPIPPEQGCSCDLSPEDAGIIASCF